MRKTLTSACVLAALAFTLHALPARAQDAEAEASPAASATSAAAPSRRRHDRRFYAAAGIGVNFGLNAGAGAKLQLSQEVGYHFLPFGDHPGLFGAITLAESFIQFTILQLGLRIGIDFLIAEGDGFSVLVAPSAASGLGLYVIPSSVIGTETRGYFDIQLAGDVKLLVGDGGLGFWLRPVSFDFFVNGLVLTRYSVLAGVTLAF